MKLEKFKTPTANHRIMEYHKQRRIHLCWKTTKLKHANQQEVTQILNLDMPCCFPTVYAYKTKKQTNPMHKAFPSELQATLPHDSMQIVNNQVHQTATKTSDMSADGHLTAWFLIRFMPLMGNRCPDLACSHVSPDLHGDEGTHPPYLRQTPHSPWGTKTHSIPPF